jgi:hypothetical protein
MWSDGTTLDEIGVKHKKVDETCDKSTNTIFGRATVLM